MPKNIERVTATSQGMQTKAHVKKHQVIIDEPAAMGGKDEGPNPWVRC